MKVESLEVIDIDSNTWITVQFCKRKQSQESIR